MITVTLADGQVHTFKDDDVKLQLMQTVKTDPEQTIELTKNAKGDMQWTITLRGCNLAELVSKLQTINTNLEQTYGKPKDTYIPNQK